ncbi:MAG: hypothetical protein H7237_06175 [Alkalinema sp. FL-bin-369]|nr:hypothetical protein [Leptolyngbyaceae cyanobacterium LF-bin-369]
MTQDIRTQQAEQDILNLLVSPDQTRLRYAPDESGGESAGQSGWQVEAVEVPMATVSYPLNPADSQDWLAELSSNSSSSLLEWLSDTELDERSTAFFRGMDQLWAPDLVAALSRKFVTVPQEMLSAIALRASQVAKTSVEQASDLAGQLIACTQSILPQWAEDDLRVFARPLVYAMRGDLPKTDVHEKNWALMSEIEQAKLTLAIAKYAMAQAKSDGPQV